MPKTTKTVVKIKWIDAYSEGEGWKAIEDLRPVDAFEVTSVGFLIRDEKKFLTLALSISENGLFSQLITIPKGWIRKRVSLKLGWVS